MIRIPLLSVTFVMYFNETFIIIIIIIIIIIKAVCQVLKTPALRKTDEAVITECQHFIHLSEAEWTIKISSVAPLPHWDHIQKSTIWVHRARYVNQPRSTTDLGKPYSIC